MFLVYFDFLKDHYDYNYSNSRLFLRGLSYY